MNSALFSLLPPPLPTYHVSFFYTHAVIDTHLNNDSVSLVLFLYSKPKNSHFRQRESKRDVHVFVCVCVEVGRDSCCWYPEKLVTQNVSGSKQLLCECFLTLLSCRRAGRISEQHQDIYVEKHFKFKKQFVLFFLDIL